MSEQEKKRLQDIESALRLDYEADTFTKAVALDDPFEQFEAWFDEILKSKHPVPNAMSLATATPDGRPSCRTVLLKDFDREGFVFFTNYESRKGQEIAENPYASLLFCSFSLHRDIRIEGRIEKTPYDVSNRYFKSRPYESQVAACVSQQSRDAGNRSKMDAEFEKHMKAYEDKELNCPPHWGGYRLYPERFEFWQGRRSRFHDRIVYEKDGQNWAKKRLYP